jgi:hypothetical protein
VEKLIVRVTLKELTRGAIADVHSMDHPGALVPEDNGWLLKLGLV